MLLFCAAGWKAAAQSFDLLPQQQQKKSKKKDTERLAQLLDANDVKGMAALLKEEPDLVHANSFQFKTASGVKRSVPLFYETVLRALDGETPPEMCQVVTDAGCDLDVVYDGYTPIYVVMDYVATHPKSQCANAVKVMKVFDSRKDFDANKRYRSELPPLNYLMRRNYDFLHGKFNADFIPDEVLQIMISHGASVTSYTEDGASLMTYAIDTDNKYLQTYFIEKGVNLRHNDAQGNDAVHQAIERGDLALLKKMISSGGVSIDINSFHNDTKKIAAYPDLYNYLATVCSQKAENYEDLVLFRKRFDDKKGMVQNKYERLAQSELNKCEKFADVVNVANRYPDLTKLTDVKKAAVYRRDYNRLNGILQTVLSVARSANLNSPLEHDSFVNEFITTYSKTYSYDPENKVSVAYRIQTFYDVHRGVEFRDNYIYYGRNSGFFVELLDLDNPYFKMDLAKEHRAMLEKAISTAKYNSDHDFANYFSAAAPVLERKLNTFINSVNRQIEQYNSEVRDYNAKLARNKAAADARRAQEEAKKEHDKRIRDAVDKDLSTIGITYKTSEWEKGWADRFFMTADHKSTYYMDVEYSDGSKGCIIKYPQTDYYLPSRGKGFFIDDTYTTLYDAIAAEYFFQFDVTRSKGSK